MKGDDEKNPISRFDPKAVAAAVTRRGTDDGDGERIDRRGGGTREEEVICLYSPYQMIRV